MKWSCLLGVACLYMGGTFAADYRKAIDKIREVNPNAKIIVCTPRKGYGFNGYLRRPAFGMMLSAR